MFVFLILKMQRPKEHESDCISLFCYIRLINLYSTRSVLGECLAFRSTVVLVSVILGCVVVPTS